MRVILDTNVIISAFATRGLCESIFELCLDRFSIIASRFILDEVARVFTEKFKLPDAQIKELIAFLEENCEIHRYERMNIGMCSDPDDNEILELASASKSDYIISGDNDLLILKEFGVTTIVSPREFWALSKAFPDPSTNA